MAMVLVVMAMAMGMVMVMVMDMAMVMWTVVKAMETGILKVIGERKLKEFSKD